jgi:hypothetical protein
MAPRPTKCLAAAAAIGLGAIGLADRADAGKLFTGQFGTSNSWNVYEAINLGLTWEEAYYYSQNAPDPTGGSAVGHLVVLGSAAENTFVNTQAPGDRWIGLTDRVGVAPGAFEGFFAWVNGEPLNYTNWNVGEPNNSSAAEDAGQMVSNGGWNDNGSGFSVDEPAPDFDSFDDSDPVFNFAIEWDTNLPSQPTLSPTRNNPAALNRVFPTPLARLPGPNGSAEGFGVREVRNAGPVAGAREGVALLASGTGTIFDGTAPVIDLRDPQTNSGGTGSVVGTELPFISHIDGTEDNDLQTVIKGTFQIPAGQGGLYTFSGRSDDGFAMRILSQATPSSPVVQHKFIDSKNGAVDVDGSLVFLYPTGDSNTQGLINLAPGTYDVEFTAFENGGGAYWELTTAKGDFVNPAPNTSAQYILLGDPSTKAQSGFAQPVRLTGNASVNNYSGNTGTIAATITNSRTATPTATGSFADVILTDGASPGSICCDRPGANLPASQVHQFPISTGDDFPDFSTFVTGAFNVTAVDTDGQPGETLTFALQSDDSTALRIIGQDFLAASPTTADGGTSTLGDPEANGDTYLLAGFESTGNANTFGTIRLMEGQAYNFEAWHRQGGGDAGMEIWVAAGDYLATGFNSSAFYPLSALSLAGNIQIANTGLALVAGPGTGPGASSPGDFDADGDVDGRDLLVWQRNPAVGNLADWKNNYGSGTLSSVTVPEPGSLGLAFACAGLVAACVRRRS